jgi:phosphoglucosamine mutase
MSRTPDSQAPLSIADTVDFLSRASSYPETTRSVEVIETHMAMVFLTDRHAYKLKKPIRRDRAGMVATMREHHADLGIAFDGDADRVVFVTPEGMLIDGDHILGILGVAFQTAGKLAGASVVATDMSNSGLAHYLEQHGIALSRTKVGDRYVMQRLREQHLVLGGEQAGHVIILDADHTCGDGIYVGLLVAALVARAKREGGPSLQTLAAQIPRYPQVIASAHLTSRVDLKQVAGLAQLEAEALASFDGKGRINMRFSGTEPNLLRVMVEGGPTTTTAEAVAIAQKLIAPVAVATGSHAPHVDLVDCATGAPIA